MTTVRSPLERHPVPAYFALTFAISWGGVLAVGGGPGGIPGTPEQFGKLIPRVALAMVAGSTLSGILMTGRVDGKTGLRALLSRSLQWRVSARWYAVAVKVGRRRLRQAGSARWPPRPGRPGRSRPRTPRTAPLAP